jgi:Poly A polymerase head domain/Probable RNA and SrmB- binding site of polymerase A
MKLTRDAQTAVEVITGLGGTALLVGGFVRDQALGIESKDIDIEVHGSVDPWALVSRLRGHGKVDTVGQSFGVIKFGQEVDISFPRRDSKTGEGHTGFTVEFDPTMTVTEALSRRDFTINSMAIDAVTGELHDPFGGMEDLHLGIIRHTSDESFADDPLRVLRAVQFASRFGFKIASKTSRLAMEMRDQFEELSVERVWVEWEKILTKGQSMRAATEALIQTGWISHFPEWGVDGAVTDRVLRTARPVGKLRVAMILGTQFSDMPQSSLDSFLARIDAPLWVRRDSRKLAGQPTVVTGRPDTDARLLARSLAPLPLQAWIDCHRAWQAPVAEFASEPVRAPLLTGDDLIARGWKPSKKFGRVLQSALFAQDVEGWLTKGEAEFWLDQWEDDE